MSSRRERLLVLGEIVWLLASTTALLALAAYERSTWRFAWLVMAVVNAGVVGTRAVRMVRDQRADR